MSENAWERNQCDHLSLSSWSSLTTLFRFLKCKSGTSEWLDSPFEAWSISESIVLAAQNAGLLRGIACGFRKGAAEQVCVNLFLYTFGLCSINWLALALSSPGSLCHKTSLESWEQFIDPPLSWGWRLVYWVSKLQENCKEMEKTNLITLGTRAQIPTRNMLSTLWSQTISDHNVPVRDMHFLHIQNFYFLSNSPFSLLQVPFIIETTRWITIQDKCCYMVMVYYLWPQLVALTSSSSPSSSWADFVSLLV